MVSTTHNLSDLETISDIVFALCVFFLLAFAVPTSDFNIQFTQDASASLLNELVTLAHASNTKVMLSVGGWSSSNYFSTAVSTYDNRVLFVNNIVKFAQQFGVDGVDIDWEVSSKPRLHTLSTMLTNFVVYSTLELLELMETLKVQKIPPTSFNFLSS